jgi:hypothetical protein
VSRNIENHNVAHARRALEELGARVTRVQQASRHTVLHFVTSEGKTYFLSFSRQMTDPFKLKGWARQSVNRAASRGR